MNKLKNYVCFYFFSSFEIEPQHFSKLTANVCVSFEVKGWRGNGEFSLKKIKILLVVKASQNRERTRVFPGWSTKEFAEISALRWMVVEDS